MQLTKINTKDQSNIDNVVYVYFLNKHKILTSFCCPLRSWNGREKNFAYK